MTGTKSSQTLFSLLLYFLYYSEAITLFAVSSKLSAYAIEFVIIQDSDDAFGALLIYPDCHFYFGYMHVFTADKAVFLCILLPSKFKFQYITP